MQKELQDSIAGSIGERRFDPAELLEELRDCIADKAFPEAVTKLAAYYRWRLRGGFEPVTKNFKGDALAERYAAGLSDALETIFKNGP